MKPYNIINPIARALALSRRRTQVIPNKKKKDKSRKNKNWKKEFDNSFMYDKYDIGVGYIIGGEIFPLSNTLQLTINLEL